ncbi:uncharacterized protein Z518_01064 [Rhinocladiella mackenziei CBS 650.93]|uniref:Suppressor protein SRP40 n=1 Tax=Rhinocladiella mackenziei CBS 650.93 TaxID=1442369 RepID=A0A0D2HH73_9EURO|nr:uncharacterized protein Z518_01064 [Rhinocladiella mackenziei CBS 650.93]KIX09983.1 hypothetical protein Z518_01064 [Rhinocladiella mackenziei CBS 650.93]
MTGGFMRLHITPFSPDLLHAVVGPNLLSTVSNISYHTIQTFPENNYGYLELPTMEAEKVKKKLHGTILKGKKMKIEEARPKKRRRVEEAVEEPAKDGTITGAKKTKKDRNVISGHELPLDRKVKRGWTESSSTISGKMSKGKKPSSTSKFSDKNELLFRTKLLPNKAEPVSAARKGKGKKKKSNDEYVVHEFEKSTIQPSFLREDVGWCIKGNLEYVEGQGWIDETGRTVEKESERILKKREAMKSANNTNRQEAKHPDQDCGVSTSSNDDDDEEKSDQDLQETRLPPAEADDETSSSGSSSDSPSDSKSDVETGASASERDRAYSASASDDKPNREPDVHPLEALFKKPSKPTSQDIAKPTLEVTTSFSFFESGNNDDIDEDTSIPGTPFSSQDLRMRGLRSAAPTPDTAHPSRFNGYGSSCLPGDDELEEDGHDQDAEAAPSDQSKGYQPLSETPSRKQSEFEKKFWENRADNNRAWKLRRRTVLKEKRQRQNKSQRPKNW